jgi:hypothetical protein
MRVVGASLQDERAQGSAIVVLVGVVSETRVTLSVR